MELGEFVFMLTMIMLVNLVATIITLAITLGKLGQCQREIKRTKQELETKLQAQEELEQKSLAKTKAIETNMQNTLSILEKLTDVLSRLFDAKDEDLDK